MLKLSTRIKAVSGYVILAVFFIATILFIVDALSDLIVSDGEEMRLNHRQQAANEVVVRLYQAEVTGQALSAGKSEYLQDYATAMMNTASAVDSLRVLTSDKVQIARIDSVKILLQKNGLSRWKVTNLLRQRQVGFLTKLTVILRNGIPMGRPVPIRKKL